MAGNSQRAIIAAFLANLSIAIAKFIGFAITRSSSMLAEGVHSVADTGNQALLLLGGHRSRREPTDAHPFGYARERYFWAFVVSVVLFALGSLFALFEGVEKLRHPHAIDSPAVAIVILSLGIVFEGLSFRTAIIESNHIRHGQSWGRFIRRTKNPELPVVLLEDFGALLGLVIALAAVSITAVTDNPRWDAAGTLAIGVLLGIIATALAIEMKSLLIGEAASEADRVAISAAIGGHACIEAVLHVRTQHLGPDEILVTADADFANGLSRLEIAEAIDDIEADIRTAVPAAKYIYIEPELPVSQ